MVVVSMARNDIRHALFKAGHTNKAAQPEFAYWVRLSTAHFFEAATATARWREISEVKEFLARLPGEARDDLASVSGSLQRIGHGIVEHSRNRTFHYAFPSSRYPAEAELAQVMENLGGLQADWVVEGDGRFRLKFADDLALALALGRHNLARIDSQLELARDGSIAFVNFATRAMEFYLQDRGFNVPGR
jgi:hypothetical protein